LTNFQLLLSINIHAPQFLDDLEAKLHTVGEKERNILLQLKKEEHEKRGLPFDGEFYIWDYRSITTFISAIGPRSFVS
jgi:hypothetical protein